MNVLYIEHEHCAEIEIYMRRGIIVLLSAWVEFGKMEPL